ELSEKVKRASVLIQLCRKKLDGTEKEVNELLKGIEKSAS
nr:exodeoxyribonuclease VII small subunit [Bacteroidia bacterium]